MTNQLITHQLPIDYSLVSLMSSIRYTLYLGFVAVPAYIYRVPLVFSDR